MKHVFIDATRENEHRIRRQKALRLSKSRDKKDETIAAIFFPALAFILVVTGLCIIGIYSEAIDNFSETAITFIGNVPVWAWTIFTLLGCSFSAWFLITRKRARG